MELFDHDMTEIKLYYKYSNNKKIIIIEEKKAKELMKDDKNDIKVINTKWATLTWEVESIATQEASNAIDNITKEKHWSFAAYRNAIIYSCLKEWDLLINNNVAPITRENINKLPASIVLGLYRKFEVFFTYTEDDLGK